MKPEYIKFYFHDFLNSKDVQGMDTLQIGAYCLLLFSSLEQKGKGYLPINDNVLREITKMHITQWNNNKQSILKKFSISEKGYYNKKMIQVISGEAKAEEVNTDTELKVAPSPIYHKMQEYIVKNFKNILTIKYQITYNQCQILTEKFKAELIKSKLKKLENIPDVSKKYNYVFYTIDEWCTKELRRK